MACAFSFLMGPCSRTFFLFASGLERGNVRLSLTVTFQRATHISSNLTGTSLGSEPGECLRDTLTLVKTLEHSPEHQILCVSVYVCKHKMSASACSSLWKAFSLCVAKESRFSWRHNPEKCAVWCYGFNHLHACKTSTPSRNERVTLKNIFSTNY